MSDSIEPNWKLNDRAGLDFGKGEEAAEEVGVEEAEGCFFLLRYF
jgi:hypothetical protein